MESSKRKAESQALVEMAPPKVPRADNQLVGIDPETKKQLMAAVSYHFYTLYIILPALYPTSLGQRLIAVKMLIDQEVNVTDSERSNCICIILLLCCRVFKEPVACSLL